MRWYLVVTSDEYGTDKYGPYTSDTQARAARSRIERNAEGDGVTRSYSVSRDCRECGYIAGYDAVPHADECSQAVVRIYDDNLQADR